MHTRKKCPACGCTRFSVTTHVTQEWEVNETGSFVKTITECSEVTHSPADDDVWTCLECGYSAAGSDFNLTPVTPIPRGNTLIAVFLHVEEADVLQAAECDSRNDAISSELGWLENSGMSVHSWKYLHRREESE